MLGLGETAKSIVGLEFCDQRDRGPRHHQKWALWAVAAAWKLESEWQEALEVESGVRYVWI